ncbi:hypothetical protein ACRALDRAFT_2031932 [Sodiomyces alcalophilus JCM 7366]|uniref:uncharacterized protein n=1 Tax=Sodiomyces alcalophilus JCM 7366 TaxID=591952 RepID=UPI0039B61503
MLSHATPDKLFAVTERLRTSHQPTLNDSQTESSLDARPAGHKAVTSPPFAFDVPRLDKSRRLFCHGLPTWSARRAGWNSTILPEVNMLSCFLVCFQISRTINSGHREIFRTDNALITTRFSSAKEKTRWMCSHTAEPGNLRRASNSATRPRRSIAPDHARP